MSFLKKLMLLKKSNLDIHLNNVNNVLLLCPLISFDKYKCSEFGIVFNINKKCVVYTQLKKNPVYDYRMCMWKIVVFQFNIFEMDILHISSLCDK